MSNQQTFYKLGLLGDNIANSLSPALHSAALKQLGLQGHYDLLQWPETKREQLPRLLNSLQQQGYCGVNVTVPYKTAVLPYLQGLSPLAKQLQAVNTICMHRDGSLMGHNTDVEGFANSLQEANIEVPAHVMLLGAGGAARAVAFALLSSGCQCLDVINRCAQRARRLQLCLQKAFPQAHIQVWPADCVGWQRVYEVDLVVNCTCLGAAQHAHQSPLPLQHRFLSSQVVCDVIYGHQPTLLLRQAAKRGARVLNGNGMLLHQAAASFALWTHTATPLTAMRRAFGFHVKTL
ncbi:MAG: shikimate dehydrogenase [Myxococcota bacterium]